MTTGSSDGVVSCWDLRFGLQVSSFVHPAKARVRRLLPGFSGGQVNSRFLDFVVLTSVSHCRGLFSPTLKSGKIVFALTNVTLPLQLFSDNNLFALLYFDCVPMFPISVGTAGPLLLQVLVSVQGNNEVGCWNLESGGRHQVSKLKGK